MSGAPSAAAMALAAAVLPDARLAFEQQRLTERGGEVERGGGALVDEVVDGVEPADDVVRVDERGAHRTASRARRAS